MSKFDLEKSALFQNATDPAEDQQQETKKKMGRPRNPDIIRDNGAQDGLTADYTRASFIISVQALNDLKDYAYTKRLSIKDALTEIIENFIADYKENPENEPLLQHKK